MFKKIIFNFLYFFLLLSSAFAQERAVEDAINNNLIVLDPIRVNQTNVSDFLQGWSLGINYGITQFKGDVRQYDHYPASQGSFTELRTAFSFIVKKKVNSLYSLSSEFITGNFGGLRRETAYQGYIVHEPYNGTYDGKGDKFVTSFYESDLLLNISLANLMSYFSSNRISKNLTYEAKVGIGYNIFRSIRTNLYSDSPIYGYGYHDELVYEDKKTLFSSPSTTVYIYGVLMNYKLNDKLDINVDYTLRSGETDKWDASLMSTQFKSDNFGFFSIGLSYKIGKYNQETEWSSPIDLLKDNITSLNASIDGLSEDSDNDGVADIFDKSQDTPLGVSVDGSGSPLDIDMDNIPDYRDADPFSNRGVLVDVNGVELDDDKDGVPNSKDLESNTKLGSMVNQFGITINYNISNASSIYLPSIYFNLGSATITSSNQERMAMIALILKNNPDIKINVLGHTDKQGDMDFNIDLGYKRANAVIDYLFLNYNIDLLRMTAHSRGEEDPLFISKNINIESVSNIKSEMLDNVNRRVDFEIIE